MRNIKLTLSYDGTAYHGWQIQENGITVQEVLETAIMELTGVKPRISGCGRTDARVHAKRYVLSFKTESAIPCEKLPCALNRYLPTDIVCIDAEDVPDTFDAQRSAKAKTYTYYVLNSQYADPFWAKRSWHYRYDVDIEKMKTAAKFFEGTHDFIGFAAAGFTVSTTVRTIYSLNVSKEEELIKIEVTGNGFLYNMVRIIAGTLIFVGNGKIRVEDIPAIIESGDRKRAGITAPPDGLYLTEVYYS